MLRVTLILIGLSATLSVHAGGASNDLGAAGVAEFTAAYQAWDGPGFAVAAERYLLGMCQFHTANKPAEWQAARQTLLKAEKLFEAEAKTTAAPLDPRWGYDSCLTFLGRTYELLGQPREPVDYFRKALALHSADHLAKEGLKRASENK